MEEEYNWNLILKVSVMLSLAEMYIFYSSLSDLFKWFSLIAALLLAGIIVYIRDKKKNNIFTAIGIVLLAALVVRFLKNFGII